MSNTGSNMSLLDRLDNYTEGKFREENDEGVLIDGLQRDSLVKEYGTENGFHEVDEVLNGESDAPGIVVFDRENREAAYVSWGRKESEGGYRIQIDEFGSTYEVVNQLRARFEGNGEVKTDIDYIMGEE
jgi:hypothetical protein